MRGRYLRPTLMRFAGANQLDMCGPCVLIAAGAGKLQRNIPDDGWDPKLP